MYPDSAVMPLGAPEATRAGWLDGAEPDDWPTLDTSAVPLSTQQQIEHFWRAAPPRPRVALSAGPAAAVQRPLPRAPLSPFARSWLQTLPSAVRPQHTAQRHPHVVNQLALAWDHPARRAECLRDLLLADRPDRQGFSFEVLDELVALQALSARC